MITEIQREVATHLLANAVRKRRFRDPRVVTGDDSIGALRSNARDPDDQYLRGMLDLLTSLYGRELTDELYRAAVALERAASTR